MLSGRKTIAFFTSAYLLAALWMAIWSSNQEFLLYLGVVLILVLIVLFIDIKASFTNGMLWCLSVWGLLHMLGGLVGVPESWPIAVGEKSVLYSVWIVPGILKYDQALHSYGFGVTMWVAYQWVKAAYHVQPALGILILCGLASLGVGAMNEIVEFAATKLLSDTNVGGYENTSWDLVFNMIGVLIAGTIIRYGEPVPKFILDKARKD